MMRKIATEEGFSIPEVDAATAKYYQANPSAGKGDGGGRSPLAPTDRMFNWDERIRQMDVAGVDMQVLLLRSPGVQIFDAPMALDLSKLVNDRAAEAVRARPTRFAALAAIPPQDPKGAAMELQRAMGSLGAHGAVINSHTDNQYLDDRKFWPILEAAEALDAPIYLHPREPAAGALPYYQTYGLTGGIWGYAAETGLHAMRMIMAGVFDQFPKLKIVLGHAGENIPFTLERIDKRFAADASRHGSKLKRKPSEYFIDNFVITSSGINWAPAVHLCQQVLGPEKVLFAIDWPSEDNKVEVAEADAIPMSSKDRALFFHGNAERVFKIRPL